jgi:prevent-host-death family protein
MKDITATEAARRFSEVLDAVEHRRESFVISRKGRPIARLNPATGASGKVVKRIMRANPRDRSWTNELRELRSLVTLEDTPWSA